MLRCQPFFYPVLLVGLGSVLTGTADAQLNPDYVFSLSETTAVPGGNATLQVFFDDPNATDNLQGWSYGVCNDSSFVRPTAEAPGDTILTVNNGDLPDFYSPAFFPNGFTMGVVICLTGCASLPPGSGYHFQDIVYDVLNQTGTTPVEFCGTLGDPIRTEVLLVTTTQNQILPETEGGAIHIGAGTPLRRGDANVDGRTDISDAIFIARWVFALGSPGTCDDAGDTNDDGAVDTLDPIHLLNALFLGTTTVPSPFGGCGADPSMDGLECDLYDAC